MAGVMEDKYSTFLVDETSGVVMDRFGVAVDDGTHDEAAIAYPAAGGRADGVIKEDKADGAYTAVMDVIGYSTWIEYSTGSGAINPGDEVTSDAVGRAVAIPTNASPQWYYVDGIVYEICTTGTKLLAKIQLVKYRILS